jgi:hypothetical protein
MNFIIRKSTSFQKSFLYILLCLNLIAKFIVNAKLVDRFQIYRMTQYDMPFGNLLGCRSNALKMEATTIHVNASQISECLVLVKINDLNIDRYRSLVYLNVGAILVILPLSYNTTQRNNMKSLESQLLYEEVNFPVYFISESSEINGYYDKIRSQIGYKFQFVVNSPQNKPISQVYTEAFNIQAELNGVKTNKQPIIIITAHYDAFGLATVIIFDYIKIKLAI